MQKNCRLLKNSLIAFSLFSVLGVSAQTEGEEFYDVIFDGKPAKMSSKTGEVKFVNQSATTSVSTVNDVTYSEDTYTPNTTSYSGGGSFHRVQSGETLYSIASQFGLSVSELKSLNGLTNNTLSIGQELKTSGTAQSASTYSTPSNLYSNNSGAWVVERGDTLYRIATASGISVDELKSLNNLTSNTISIGQRLITKNN